MDNPIQQVLAAEQDASREILEARAAAERSVSAARRSAKGLLDKTEQRLNRATARFEQHARRAREVQAAETRRLAERDMQSRFEQIDSRLAKIVATAFESNWPSAGDD